MYKATEAALFSLEGIQHQTDEEKFMKQVLESRNKHARAKILILQFVGLILDKTKWSQLTEYFPDIDPKDISVKQIFSTLNI